MSQPDGGPPALSSSIELVVGLGNPGARYQGTRHNAGFWFLDALAADCKATLRVETKFRAELGRAIIDGRECWLAKPTGFMNCSGETVGAIARFYKIPAASIVVVHDELDLPPGTARLKQGGGHGGHNGLRDIVDHHGGNDFIRLRIGIGHPGSADLVTDYVLSAPSHDDRQNIMAAVNDALGIMPVLLNGELQKAMHALHSERQV